MGCMPYRNKAVDIAITAPSSTKMQDNIRTNNSLNEKIPFKLKTGDNIKIKNLITKGESCVDDNYKIISKLGEGSYGAVFKVTHLKTGLIRALKQIKRTKSDTKADDESKFIKEIEILIECDHPNIIKIFEYYSDENNYYIITEYISGGELYQAVVADEKFDEANAAHIISQILSAVTYLHSKNIVHRDLKPENILVEKKRNLNNKEMNDQSIEYLNLDNINVKLIDFGTSNHFRKNSNMTTKMGSPYYIAPEVILKNYNEKCDIWSCGVILYVLLVGYTPFNGKNLNDLLDNICKADICVDGPNWDKVSNKAKKVVVSMLERNIEKRASAAKIIIDPWFETTKSKNIQDVDQQYFASVLKNISRLDAMEKLQQVTKAYIVHFLYVSEELDKLRDVFKLLDKNGDGRLTYEELKSGYMKVFGKTGDISLNNLMIEVDGDKDGYISYEEFLRVAISQTKLFEEKNLRIAFERFDINKDGVLSKDEIKEILGTSDNEYINYLLQCIDKNQDGFISYVEFYSFMNNVINNTSIDKINAKTLLNSPSEKEIVKKHQEELFKQQFDSSCSSII